MRDPVEMVDSGNIKIIADENEYALSLSGTPISYPYKSIEFKYYKTVTIKFVTSSLCEEDHEKI